VLTVNGRVKVWRIRWHSPETGSLTVIDQYLDRAEESISVGTLELAARLNNDSANFDRTAENLLHAAQIQISGETLRQRIESEGRRVLQVQREGKLPVTWSAADCRVNAQDTNSPCRVYLGCDGVTVAMVTDAEKRKRRQAVKEKRRRCGRKRRPLPRVRPGADWKYKEFKIVALYDERQAHRLVMGTKDDHRGAGRMMRGLAAAVKFDQADEKIGNVDGAPWIRRQMERQNLPLDAIGLDFYHLAENVHKARRVVWGEDDEAGKTWTGELLHVFKHEGYKAAWERLLAWRGKLRGSKRAAADTLLNYVSDRRDMIQYPDFQKKGWQIGSGPTEATCKTSTARLKRSGMRWDGVNSEAIMALESLSQSGMWKAYWKSRLPIPFVA
jgi:hypothetical protein